MVAVARIINATLVTPELDKRSFWLDSRYSLFPFIGSIASSAGGMRTSLHLAYAVLLYLCSNFADVFDEDHFINSLANDIKVIKELPEELVTAPRAVKHFRSWSGLEYYQNEIASLWANYQVLI